MKHILYYLLIGTRGGETRIRIINSIIKKPKNANQLSSDLSLDYKTVQHHLKILTENKVLKLVNEGSYGAVYFLSEYMEQNINLFNEIWAKFGKK